jgi:ABC-type dipeptide/oligopeptide/nickel transport system permease subunit
MREALETGPGAAPITTVGAPPEIAARSPWRLFWNRFREDKLAMVSLFFLGLVVFVAIFAPLIVDVAGLPGPNEEDSGARDIFGTATGPSSEHLLGVDNRGRDILSRTIYGARVSILVAVVATALATAAGVVAGIVAGYFRGWADTLVSRTVDVMLAIPYLLLATGLAASCSLGNGCFGGLVEPGLSVVIFVIAVTSWTYIARIVRGGTLSLREKEFVEASRSLGASHPRIIFREILPNLVAPIVVYVTVLIPQVILYESALSFLGVGVGPRTPSWGQMIAEATSIFDTAWWFMLFPGLALLFTVLAFNLVGDALQDALHPRTRRS